MSKNSSVAYYDEFGQEFASSTAQVDMQPLYDRFLGHLLPGASILDAGCGSGRDSLAFKELGYQVTAMDGSQTMVRLATEHSGLPVQNLKFQDIDFVDEFDGIWACASLLHLERAELGDAVRRLVRAGKKGGIVCMSFKRGEGDRVSKGRHFTDFTMESLALWLQPTSQLQPIEFWETGDQRPDRVEERWTNALLRIQR